MWLSLPVSCFCSSMPWVNSLSECCALSHCLQWHRDKPHHNEKLSRAALTSGTRAGKALMLRLLMRLKRKSGWKALNVSSEMLKSSLCRGRRIQLCAVPRVIWFQLSLIGNLALTMQPLCPCALILLWWEWFSKGEKRKALSKSCHFCLARNWYGPLKPHSWG